MVRLFAFLRRRQGTSVEEFLDHWRNHHGPLIADTPELARHLVRYEQYPRHRPDGLSGTDGLDGVAVQWFRSIDDFAAFLSEPAYAELVAPDEKRLLDMDAVEFVICDGPNTVIGDGTAIGDGPAGSAAGGDRGANP